MYHNIEFTKETSVCEKCIEENNNCVNFTPNIEYRIKKRFNLL